MESTTEHTEAAQRIQPLDAAAATTGRKPLQRWLFRFGAIGVGVSLILLVELGLSLAGIGSIDDGEDPFVGFESIQPLFVLDEDGLQYQVADSRLAFFRPQQFPAAKANNTFRIFCLGGSTVQGRPFSTETAFAAWLQVNLQSVQPDSNWEVINCGGISYASYRLVPILDECLEHSPDLIILCTGHNEFLEERSYAHIRSRSSAMKTVHRIAMHSRIHSLLSGYFRDRRRAEQPASGTVLSKEVDALLDYRGGLATYQRDEEWRQGVVEHYESNVRRMISKCRSKMVPILLIRPPSNLSDCPPFKSLSTDDLNPDTQAKIAGLVEDARASRDRARAMAVSSLTKARELDPLDAGLAYELGIAELADGQVENARSSFIAARDLDICPLRMITELEERLSQIASDSGIPLLDAHELLQSESSDPILGGFLLVDHIHPSVHGHQIIAGRLTEMLAEQGIVSLPEKWTREAQSARQAHLKSLDEIYFLRGMRTLEALRAWTEGRVDGPQIESRGAGLSPDEQ